MDEGIIKATQKNEVKHYLYYLTRDNRAYTILEKEFFDDKDNNDFVLTDNEEITILENIIEEKTEEKELYSDKVITEKDSMILKELNEYFKPNQLSFENNNKNVLSFIKDYDNSLKREKKGNTFNVKSLELIFSYSDNLADEFAKRNLKNEYEKEFTDIIYNTLKNNKYINSFKHNITFFHKHSKSEKYRPHAHTLIYPYRYENGIYIHYTKIENEELKNLKKQFKKEAIKLKQKYGINTTNTQSK
jgi:hypothetical protein